MHLFISNYEIFFNFLAVKLVLERELTILFYYWGERNGRRAGSLILDVRYLDYPNDLILLSFLQQQQWGGVLSFDPLLRPFKYLLDVQISDT